MYRLGIEAIFGLRREGTTLRIDPHITRDWSHFEVDYRYGASVYHIRVMNPNGVESGVGSVWLDDTQQPSNSFPLADDGTPHRVLVSMA